MVSGRGKFGGIATFTIITFTTISTSIVRVYRPMVRWLA